MELPPGSSSETGPDGRVVSRSRPRDRAVGHSRPCVLLRQGFRTRCADETGGLHASDLTGAMGNVSGEVPGRTVPGVGPLPDARRSAAVVRGVLPRPAPRSSGALVLLVVRGGDSPAHRVS